MATYDIAKIGSGLEFDTVRGAGNSSIRIDDTHFINFWVGGASGYLLARVFEINQSTGVITPVGSLFTVSTTGPSAATITAHEIDSNHFVVFYNNGGGYDGRARVIEVNLSTWNITALASELSYGVDKVGSQKCCRLDNNHFVSTYARVSTGYAQVFEINLSTWAITTVGTETNFYSSSYGCDNPVPQNIDNTHFVVIFGSNYNGYSVYTKVIEVNNSTWVMTGGDNLWYRVYSNTYVHYISKKIDSTHFLLATSGRDDDGFAMVVEINISTLTASFRGTIEMDTINMTGDVSCYVVDSNHIAVTWTGGASNYGYLQILQINLSDWSLSALASPLLIQSFFCNYFSIFIPKSGLIGLSFSAGSDEGYIQLFSVEIPYGPANLKSYNTNLKANIKTINTNPIANVKSLNTNV